MNTKDALELLTEVADAGRCSHPIRLSGTSVNLATGEIRASQFRVACKDRRAVLCPSCSALYNADAWVLVTAGLLGGKGVPSEVEQHPRLFVTVTAPGFGSVHRSTAAGWCHPRERRGTCEHGVPTTCARRHDALDPILGSPICPACFDYEGAILWNAMASKLWHRTIVRLRQVVAASHSLTDVGLLRVARLNYLKVAEVQRRGLIHFHAVIRADGPDGPLSDPPEWLTSELLAHELRQLVRTLSLVTPAGQVRWGTQLQIRDIAEREGDGRRVASYLAKYATKTTDSTQVLARQFHSRSQIERIPIAEHSRTLALTAWDLGGLPELQELRLRLHAHTFGFAGQLITKSQGYSTTFQALRHARAQYVAATSDSDDPISGSYAYAGRGYSSPKGEALAELLHNEAVELRQEARERRARSRSGSQEGSQDDSRPVSGDTADPQ